MLQSSYWQRRPKIWYCSVPAPWGRMPLRDWNQRNCQKNRTKPNYFFLQIIHVRKSFQERIQGHCGRARTSGEQVWGEPTLLDPLFSHSHTPKGSQWFRELWLRVGILRLHPKAPIPQPGLSQRSAATQGLTRILSPCTAFLPAYPLTELALEICALCYVGGRRKKKRKGKGKKSTKYI